MKPIGFKKSNRGTTFVELLLYIAIFLVLTPILLMVSVNAIRTNRQHNVERQVNADSQFMVERVYDLIGQAKKVDLAQSTLGSPNGKLTLSMQDDATVVIERNPATSKVEITEGGVKSDLSSMGMRVDSLYFEKITDQLNDPEIAMGINVRLAVAATDPNSNLQTYVSSANLEKGDFDNDGSPDYADKFPKNSECAGDADNDGVCDELDNAVMAYNPFQEDFDADGIGDVVDVAPFEATDGQLATGHGSPGDVGGGGMGGNDPAFNCSSDQQLIDLINSNMASSKLRSILIAASPLSPTVLNYLIAKQSSHNVVGEAHFVAVMVANCKLPGDVYANMLAMSLNNSKKNQIKSAHDAATKTPWDNADKSNEITYQVTHPADAFRTEFRDADRPLGADQLQKTDLFTFMVQNGTDTVNVTTRTSGGDATSALVGAGASTVDSKGFGIAFEYRSGVFYVFKVSSVTNESPLAGVTFDFGTGATVSTPTGATYLAHRYTYYCLGGCATNCGDVGTGIVIGNIFTDKCYKANGNFPEWCSKWLTFNDDNAINPSYLGATLAGEQTLYWEKEFKTILTSTQLQNLKSITVGGEVAYQSTTQFFCDQFQQSCPMNGTLVGPQNVELFNWQTNAWQSVLAMALDGTKSDQQKFELAYNASDVLKFVGGPGNRTIRARMPFHWNGVVPQGQASAPAFMLIDYFTLHLKW